MRLKVTALVLAAIGCIAGVGASSAWADYPRVSAFDPATTVFLANRPNDLPIDSVMIHDTEETYQGTVTAFTRAGATAAVQYAVTGQHNSSDPAVTQFAHDKDWTRSVNKLVFNQTSIGIEHIGFALAPAGYFTAQLYERSADLVGWTAWKYRIPSTALTSLGTTTSRIPSPQGRTCSTGIPARRGTGRTT